MIVDLLCIDNVFDNPDTMVELARIQDYLPSGPDTKISYSGIRTSPLNTILDEDIYTVITNQIMSKLFKDSPNSHVKAKTTCLFHLLTGEHIPNQSWIHKDTSLYSGVVYLNKNFVDKFNNHGTKIFRNGEEINIRYEYNKLVLYKGDYLHAPNFGFGDTFDDARLTFNFFINDIQISMENPNQIDYLSWQDYYT